MTGYPPVGAGVVPYPVGRTTRASAVVAERGPGTWTRQTLPS
jgi:hypothetical protein